ncbi:MAG: IS110 family transposase [Syntrophobacterales bacterium]|jgi:transposase|nr:IS110 family transposase [Syntrophobacterales bacterium]
MRHPKHQVTSEEDLFVGIDLHKERWHVTIRTMDLELFSASIPGTWEALHRVLARYAGHRLAAVYEAGYFGFRLHDRLVDHGIPCLVTPPSLVPQEYCNRVKTDRRDSRKLAHLLAKGMLKRVWVPSEEERYHRQVVRRRRQLVRDRVRTQSRIKAELRFYGIHLAEPRGRWTQMYFESLCSINFGNRWMQESFNRLLEQYEFLTAQIDKQTKLLRELSETALYQKRVEILQSIPGIGVISAMELLLELQDVSRFRRAEQLAAYVGLTPSQYSSADKVRMGRITGIGKNTLRAILVEASWQLITKDQGMREKYDRIKIRSGGKRAIVAIARTLLLRMRRMLLDERIYTFQLAA